MTENVNIEFEFDIKSFKVDDQVTTNEKGVTSSGCCSDINPID